MESKSSILAFFWLHKSEKVSYCDKLLLVRTCVHAFKNKKDLVLPLQPKEAEIIGPSTAIFDLKLVFFQSCSVSLFCLIRLCSVIVGS